MNGFREITSSENLRAFYNKAAARLATHHSNPLVRSRPPYRKLRWFSKKHKRRLAFRDLGALGWEPYIRASEIMPRTASGRPEDHLSGRHGPLYHRPGSKSM